MPNTVSLPRPHTDALRRLVSNETSRKVYEVLFAGAPLTIDEIKARLDDHARTQMHLDRRLRSLDDHFEIAREKKDGKTSYRLVGVRLTPAGDDGRISARLRAEVLARDSFRCQMCGASPADKGAKLVIDHRVPRSWGGKTEADNLWAVCVACNSGKKAFFATASSHDQLMKDAVAFDDVWNRLGTLLKGFGVGVEVPEYLLSIAASAGSYHDDWQRRLRDLRDSGWDYSVRKRKENGRFRSYYVLERVGTYPLAIAKPRRKKP